MNNCYYKKKIWNILPHGKFIPGCIKNILISRSNKWIITNIKEIKIINNKFKTLDNYE